MAAASEGNALPSGVIIRQFHEDDFGAIQRLSSQEGWPTPLERPDDTLQAWLNSTIALVAVSGEEDGVVGFLRALSDHHVSTFVCELFVEESHRGQGLGRGLVKACHGAYPETRLDLLATESSRSFYEESGFRPFWGFRLSSSER